MTKFILMAVLMCGTHITYASPFVQEDFIPVAASGYGCYIKDDIGNQIMVADVIGLKFDKQMFYPVSHALFDEQKLTRYQTDDGKNTVLFQSKKWSFHDDVSSTKGKFKYYQEGKLIYRGTFSVECGV